MIASLLATSTDDEEVCQFWLELCFLHNAANAARNCRYIEEETCDLLKAEIDEVHRLVEKFETGQPS